MRHWSKAKWGGLAILIPFSAMIVGSIYLICAHTLLWVSGESAKGEIVSTQLVPDEKLQNEELQNIDVIRAPSNAYNVSFQTIDGQEVVFTTKFSSSMKLYRVGKEVTVLYWKDSPDSAKILGFMSLYLGPLLALFMGFVFWLIGLFLFLSDKPKRRYIKN